MKLIKSIIQEFKSSKPDFNGETNEAESNDPFVSNLEDVSKWDVSNVTDISRMFGNSGSYYIYVHVHAIVKNEKASISIPVDILYPECVVKAFVDFNHERYESVKEAKEKIRKSLKLFAQEKYPEVTI